MRAQVRMYTAITKAMVRSNRKRNFSVSQSQMLPPQRREPASARANQIDILYLCFILSDFLILYGFQRWGSWVSIFIFLCPRISDIFYASFRRGGRFRFRGVKRLGLGQTRFTARILSAMKWKCRDCCRNGLPPRPFLSVEARNYLGHWQRTNRW